MSDLNWLAIPALIASVGMIAKGADLLTDSVWHISLRRGVSAGMLGMALAGVMTTLPEVSVSSIAVAMKSGGLSIGNALGSTIFNVLGIIGVIGLIRPLNFDRSFLRDFGRNALMVYLAFYLLALLRGSIGTLDGILLLGVLLGSLYYGYRRRYVGAASAKSPPGSSARDGLELLLGGGLLGGGSYLLVYSAREIASAVGVPEVVIGLTLVAVGTSIPELATGVASTRKGIEEISIGNILGANIYDVTLALGLAAIIGGLLHGQAIPLNHATLFFDIPVMVGATALLMVVGRNGHISRRVALSFIVLYAVYLVVTFTWRGF